MADKWNLIINRKYRYNEYRDILWDILPQSSPQSDLFRDAWERTRSLEAMIMADKRKDVIMLNFILKFNWIKLHFIVLTTKIFHEQLLSIKIM